ncbi:40S ribosomal protein S30 [Trichinella murrelli]|uniref:40S ribosomal protein S30 n=1 Tax=Trichinella murrelli TaxID=144512 RepID=A0A0V0U547_9BILA|nr:40S ribosomal protein S30 [Trichinella murrelli]
MLLFIRGLGKNFSVTLNDDANITDLMKKIEDVENVNPQLQSLIFQGHILHESLEGNLYDNGVRHLSTIDLCLRLCGGKVHGSLARAGKVRGQTPKVVEKKEKKKQKTGRAKRRMQYTRRFINAVSFPPGRRRGPNSNQAKYDEDYVVRVRRYELLRCIARNCSALVTAMNLAFSYCSNVSDVSNFVFTEE